MENVLVNAGPLTVFAPVNAAFEALPPGTVEDLLKPENKQTLAKTVTSHAAPGKFPVSLLKDGEQLYMATGHYLDIEVRDDGTSVNGSRILGSVEATDGMVHVIGEVFLVAIAVFRRGGDGAPSALRSRSPDRIPLRSAGPEWSFRRLIHPP